MQPKHSSELIRMAQSVLEQAKPEAEALSPLPVDEQAAEQALSEELETHELQVLEPATNLSEIVPVQQQTNHVGYLVEDEPMSPPAASGASQFQKFGSIPDTLREGDGVDLYEVKRLNLAVAVEALERAMQAHESYPSPDAGFAVASLSDQVMKLTKDIERSEDTKRIHERIMKQVVLPFSEQAILEIMKEFKGFLVESRNMVPLEKREAFETAFKNTTKRLGPAFADLAKETDSRLLTAMISKKDKR